MGINLGRVKDIDVKTINELFLLTQPAHLQKLQGESSKETSAEQPARITSGIG